MSRMTPDEIRQAADAAESKGAIGLARLFREWADERESLQVLPRQAAREEIVLNFIREASSEASKGLCRFCQVADPHSHILVPPGGIQ